MRELLEKLGMPVFAPAGDPPAGDPPAGDPPAGDPPAGDPPAGDPPGPSTPPAGSPYRPEGLPDTMFGQSDKETMDNMAAALKGYRAKDAARVVPDDPTGYADFSKAEVPEEMKSYVDTLKDDPVYKEMAGWAKEQGKDVGEFQSIVIKAFETAGKANLLSPLVDPEAEQTALVPDELKTASPDKQREAASARVDAAENAIKLMIENKGIDEAVGQHAMLSLLDTANGVKFLEAFIAAKGGGAQPSGGGGGNQSTMEQRRAALRAEMAKPEMRPGNPKYDPEKFKQLDEEYKKLLG